MTDEEVLRTRDDLEMMRRRHLWPESQLYLCLKNPRLPGRGGWPSFAVLFWHEGKYYFIPRRKEEGKEEKLTVEPRVEESGEDELLRALVGEGWLVD